MRISSRIKVKVLFSLTLVFSLMSAGLFTTFSLFIQGEYATLEEQFGEENLQRISLAVRSSQFQLAAQTDEWAKWDDTYQYMEDKNSEYRDQNLTYESLSALKISFLVYYDLDGKIFDGYQINQDEESVSALNEGARTIFENAKYLQKIGDTENYRAGFFAVGSKVFLASATKIQDSTLTSAPRGVMVRATEVFPSLVNLFGLQTNLPLQAVNLRENSKTDLPIINELLSKSKLEKLEVTSGSELTGFILQRDIFNSPIILFKFASSRTIYQQGINARNFVVGFVLLSALLALILLFMLIDWWVVSRLQNLSSQIQEIAENRLVSQRLALSGGDELKSLANDVNAMLSALESSEQQLRIARDAAQAANLAKSTFVAKVSHELRTPIHSIVGMLRILFKEERSTAKRDYIKMARDAAYSLLGTINDILDFSKIESGNLTLETVPLNLRDLVRETLRTVGPRAEEKHELELVGYIDPKIPEALLGDPLRIKQSIINLLSNAVKFTASGCVSVDVELIDASLTQAEIMFSVRDTGVGIPEHRLSKIFDPFTQADESVARVFQGTGLGLTIVKQLVEAMDGSVTVTSRVGLGTDFVLKIPFSRPQPPVAWDLPRPTGTGKVLVVDGQTAACEGWRKLLKIQGYTSTWINSKDDKSVEGIAQQALGCEFVVLTEDALQRSAIFNFVVETTGKVGNCPVVAILSPFAISLREKLLSLDVKQVLVRPCLPDDILLSLSGRLDLTDHAWEGDLEVIGEVTRTLEILIADDTYTNRFILQSMLEEGGHIVTAVTNGQELLDLITESITNSNAKKFDVVFTDVQMPLLDGITATQRIRELERGLNGIHTTIIAVTAHAMTEEKSKMRDSGVDDVITKPVEPGEVARVLVKISEAFSSRTPPPAKTTPVRHTKIVVGNDLDLEAIAIRVWTQFLESGGDIGELVQAAVDGQEIPSDKDGLHSFLNVQETFERSGGSLRRTIMIFRAFLNSFKDVLADVAHAKSEKNTEELRKASHTLKGLLLEVGAKQPGSVAGSVEQLCNAGKLEEALKLINPVTHQTLAAARILEKIVEAVEVEQKLDTQTNQPAKI